MYFLIMWSSGIIAITNSNGDSRLPGISLTEVSPLLSFSSCYLFDSPVFNGILDKLYDFAGYLGHFKTILRDHIIYLFVVYPRHS